MVAMFSRLDELFSERANASPALGVARAFGVETDRLRARILLVSIESDFRRPELQASVAIDSELAEWFRIAIVVRPWRERDRRTEFNHRTIELDELRLGRCDATALPSYLVACAKAHNKQWNWPAIQLTTNLRGRKRTLLMSWLGAR